MLPVVKQEKLEEPKVTTLEDLLILDSNEPLTGQIIFDDSDDDVIEIADEYETLPVAHNKSLTVENTSEGRENSINVSEQSIDINHPLAADNFVTIADNAVGKQSLQTCVTINDEEKEHTLDEILSLLEEKHGLSGIAKNQKCTNIQKTNNPVLTSLLEKETDEPVQLQNMPVQEKKRYPRTKVTSLRDKKNYCGKMDAMKSHTALDQFTRGTGQNYPQMDPLLQPTEAQIEPLVQNILRFVYKMTKNFSTPYFQRMESSLRISFLNNQKHKYYGRCYDIVKRYVMPRKSDVNFIDNLVLLITREATRQGILDFNLGVLKKAILDLINWTEKGGNKILPAIPPTHPGSLNHQNGPISNNTVNETLPAIPPTHPGSLNYHNGPIGNNTVNMTSVSNNGTINIIAGPPGQEIKISYNATHIRNNLTSRKETVSVSELQKSVGPPEVTSRAKHRPYERHHISPGPYERHQIFPYEQYYRGINLCGGTETAQKPANHNGSWQGVPTPPLNHLTRFARSLGTYHPAMEHQTSYQNMYGNFIQQNNPYGYRPPPPEYRQPYVTETNYAKQFRTNEVSENNITRNQRLNTVKAQTPKDPEISVSQFRKNEVLQENDVTRNQIPNVDQTQTSKYPERSVSRDSGFISPPADMQTSSSDSARPDTTQTMSQVSTLNVVGACEPVKNRCMTCNQYTTMLCLGCNYVYYCSVTCQNAHWNRHKVFCRSKNKA